MRLRHRCALFWLLGAALACVSACDGFGRPIVGTLSTPSIFEMCGPAPPECGAMPSFEALVPGAAPSFSLLSCGNRGATCAAATGPQLGCNAELALSGGVAAAPAAFPTSLTCVHASVTVPPTTAPISLGALIVDHAEISFTAASPVTVELVAAQLSFARIELRGPITLVISADSLVANTQILDMGNGSSSLAVSESKTSTFEVVGLSTVSFERSSLTATQVFASTVRLEDVALTAVSVAARQLSAVELRGTGLTLEVVDGTVSQADLQQLTLQKCDTFLLVGSSVYNSKFAACSDKLRVDRGAIGHSMLSGPIESHIVIWDFDIFAAGVSTSLQSWGDSVSNNRFCSGTREVSLGGVVTTLVCNYCSDVMGDASELFCQIPSAGSAIGQDIASMVTHALDERNGNPGCPVLQAPPVCDPLPRDTSPF